MPQHGTLYLLPIPLGEHSSQGASPQVVALAQRLRIFIVENTRTARRFLRSILPQFPIDDSTFWELNEHTADSEITRIMQALLDGHDVGLMSEAGCPAVADPGALAVAWCHRNGITVVPLVGASSILLALMASGLNGQHFAFQGYLPVPSHERSKALQQLEQLSHKQTQIFIETPYRNQAMLQDLLKHLQANTLLCIACDLTLSSEFIATKTIQAWRKEAVLPNLQKRPTVFLLGK